jgi:hypothetical protein
VEQRDTGTRSYQINGYAVGSGNGQQDARAGRDPAINAVHLNPPAPAVEGEQFNTMDLVA